MLLFGYPVHVLVGFDTWAVRVDKNDFEPFVSSIFTYPVTVQDFHVGELSCRAFFGDESYAFAWFELGDTHTFGSSSRAWTQLSQSASAHSCACYNEALFGFVAEFSCLVKPCRVLDA
jgi:hypothetical protein